MARLFARSSAAGSLPGLLSAPTIHFWGLLSLLVVAGCAGYAALVLYTASPASALALPTTFAFPWDARRYTAVEFESLRRGLAGLLFSSRRDDASATLFDQYFLRS